MKTILFISLFFSSFILPSFTFAKELPELIRPVQDELSILSDETKNKLEDKIRGLHKNNMAQIGVLIIESLDGVPIEEYSIKLAEKWKLGSQKEDNGLILLIALNDRKLRIEVGQGLEHIITDLKSARIIDGMKPFLKDKRYDEALNFAILEFEESLLANTPERLAEKARQDEIFRKKLAIQKEKLTNTLIIVSHVILLGCGLILLYHSYILRKTNPELISSINELDVQLKTKEIMVKKKAEELKSIKIDEKTIQQHKLLEKRAKIEAEISELESKIFIMKKTLGV